MPASRSVRPRASGEGLRASGGGPRSPGPARRARARQAPPSDRGPVQRGTSPEHSSPLSAKLHWITASFKGTAEEVISQDLDAWTGPLNRGLRFFGTHSWEHEGGGVLYFRPGESGCILNVPGEALDLGGDWVSLIAMLGGKITRVDVAVDLGPCDQARERMLQMHSEWMGERVETEIRTFSEQRSYGAGEGFTWYFGGKAAALRLRVYDRRGPLRLEFQWRPDDRNRLVSSMLGEPARLWRMMAERIVFRLPWYEKLLRGESAEFDMPKPETDYERAALALKDQWGEALWAFMLLGMTADSFVAPPFDRLRSSTKSKFKRWAFQAGEKGKRLLAALELR